jgi:hypothetical protein
MSTLTASAPIIAPRRTRSGVRALGAARQGAPVMAGSAAPRRRLRPESFANPAATSSLRLTRRGRLVILLLLLAVGVVVSLTVTSSGSATATAEHAPVQYVTVAPGDTLWSIAGDVSPNADPRDTVADIIELNALNGSTVQAGQRIAVPQGR